MRCFARLFSLCLLLSSFDFAAHAATLTVTSNADSGANTLRAAIASAAPGDTIVFAGNMTIPVSSTLTISEDLTIDATGLRVVVDGSSGHFSCFTTTHGIIQITQLVVQNCTSPTDGGGVQNTGSLTLTNCTLSGNAAADRGGAIYNVGTLTLVSSTLSRNATGVGGGIHNTGPLNIINSTFSDNTATAFGGSIFIYTPGMILLMINSTVSGSGSDMYVANGQILAVNDIVAGGCSGAVIDGGGNLDVGTTCGFYVATSRSNATLNLGPLQNNGGPTQTMVPGAGSMAIDAGIDESCAFTGVDQRGIPRPQGPHCDSGAVEVVVPQTLAVVVTGNGSVSAGINPAPQSGGISNCTNAGGANCSATYAMGQNMTLFAAAPTGEKVTWGGACAAAGNATAATVVMSAAQSCTASFAANSPAVSAPILDHWAKLLLGGLLGASVFWRLRRAGLRI